MQRNMVNPHGTFVYINNDETAFNDSTANSFCQAT